MPMRKTRGQRLPDTVAAQIAAAVRSGEFEAGKKLPPERELAERFGVSRNVVREAVNELRSRGLLATRQGSGSVVIDKAHKPVNDLFMHVMAGRLDGEAKLLELRCALEIDAARYAAGRATRRQRDVLAGLLDAYDAAGDDLDACVRLDLAFHRALVQASHNELFGVVLASIDELLAKARRASLRRSGVKPASASHRRILKAVLSGQPAAAGRAMERHLAQTRAYLTQSLSGNVSGRAARATRKRRNA